MFQRTSQRTWILSITLIGAISGCDDPGATQIAREAADRQAKQNTAMSELNKEVAGGSHELVAADAQARKEIVGVHHELQAERTRLDTGWDALEKERRQIASEPRTESMLVPAVEVFGGLVLAIVLLGFCWYALVAARRGDDSDPKLDEILMCEILNDEWPVIAHGQVRRDLLGPSQSGDRPNK